MSIATIKQAIKTRLDELVTANVLAAATIADIRLNPLNHDTNRFPHAFLLPPALSSEVLDNRSIIRTYTFDITVLVRAENLTSTTEVETLVESIATKFDNDPDLGGTALGGVLPVSSAPEPYTHNGRDMIMIVFQVQAKEVVMLTFA